MPVIANGRLYLRDDDRLYCFDVSANALSMPKDPKKVTHIAPKLNPRVADRHLPVPVYLPTPQEVVTRMVVEAKLMAGQKLVDLGSGDGRIVVTAAKQFGARSVGYEIDKELVAISRTKIAEAKITDLASIEASDLFKADLTDVDVLAIYLYPVVMDQLKKQIENMHRGAIWDWRTTFDLYLQTPIENTTQRWKQELAIEQFKCPCSSRIAMHDGITFLISVTVAKQ